MYDFTSRNFSCNLSTYVLHAGNCALYDWINMFTLIRVEQMSRLYLFYAHTWPQYFGRESVSSLAESSYCAASRKNLCKIIWKIF